MVNERYRVRSISIINGKTIEDTAQRIALEFAPEKIILFRSYARGQPTEDSDVDLLVVMSFEGKPFDKRGECELRQ